MIKNESTNWLLIILIPLIVILFIAAFQVGMTDGLK